MTHHDEMITRLNAATDALNERVRTAHQRQSCPLCGMPRGTQCIRMKPNGQSTEPAQTLKHSHRVRVEADGTPLR